MALVQEGAIDELLQAQLHVCNHIDYSFARSMALKCAVELSIPDIIHDQGRPAGVTLSDLATALDLPPEKKLYLGRLMRLLVHSGFFTTSSTLGLAGGTCGAEDVVSYHLTPSSKLLVKANKLSMAPLVLLELDPNSTSPLHKLSAWFQHNDLHLTPFELAYGSNAWDYICKNPEVNDMFNKAMVGDSLLTITVFVHKCGGVLDGVRSLVDVGGGTGATAKLIADAFPGIKCTVLDLPHVVAGREDQNVTGIEFVGGDMFLSIPKADAVFLKGVFHSWSDEDCVKILLQCKEAIPSKEKGGKVIIVEIVVGSKPDDANFMETSLLADLLMMAYAAGKEREEHEWKKIFHDAGFSDYRMMHVLGLRSVIEVYP